MSKLAALVYGDFKRILRDRTLTMFLLGPVFMVLILRYFVPQLTRQFPAVAEYHPLIMMFGAIQCAVMFGFIVSFITLDEKDEHVMQVIRILPISTFYFIIYRLSFATVFSALGAFLMISLSGLAYPGFTASIMLSLQYGLLAPVIILTIVTYAQNKVEGMAYFKGVDLLLIMPILAFVLGGISRYLFMPIPAYWTYTLYDTLLKGQSPWLIFLIGLLVYGLVIALLFAAFRKRVFAR
jgi:predicted permease